MSAATHGKLDAADRAVNDYFTSTGDLKAQRYDPSPAGTDSGPEEALMASYRQRERARFDEVRRMMVEVDHETRATLTMIYAYGADALENAPADVKVGIGSDRMGRLRLQMSPSWGHGSYLRIAVRQERATMVLARRHHGVIPTSDEVLDMMVTEANDHRNSPMLAAIRNECEAIRNAALATFDVVRARHAEVMRSARAAKQTAELRTAETSFIKAERRPACLQLSSEERERLGNLARQRLAELTELGS